MNSTIVLNHLWQSTWFFLGAALVAGLLQRHAARLRFAVWMAASLKFLVPFAGLGWVVARLGVHLPRTAAVAAVGGALPLAAPSFSRLVYIDGASAGAPMHTGNSALVAGLAALWAVGAVAMLARWGWRWRQARQAAMGASEPSVFGVFRQRILMPSGIESRLSADELAAVVAHEGCHMRRRDNLWSALHMLAEAIFWFHPAVWILGERLVVERERACDEAVIARGGDRVVYASAMVKVCRHYLAAAPLLAAGISGGSFAARVRAVLGGGVGRRLSLAQRVGLGAVALVAIGGPVVLVTAQQAAPAATFEAATIKPSAPPTPGKFRFGIQLDPKRLTATNQTLRDLIVAAYGLQEYQVKGPDWIQSERFDVTAVSATPADHDQMMGMLKQLIEQRFQLHTHHDSKSADVYVLEVAPGGSKLKDPGAAGYTLPPELSGIRLNGGTIKPGQMVWAMEAGGSMRTLAYSNLDTLAKALGRQLDKPVLNHTDLKGNYAIDLSFAPPPGSGGALMRRVAALRAARKGEAGATPDDSGASAPAPSIFTAVESQLGLKLVAQKAPMDLLVVDSALQTPIAN